VPARVARVDRAADEVAALAPGVEVVVTGSVTGLGLDRLRDVLTGTVVLLGLAARSDARLRAERENHRRTISRSLRATYRFRGNQR
jgi:ribosome biogenesis GTPase